MITSNEATDAVLASDLAELIKSLSLRMGTMQRQIETIMTGGTTEPVPLDKDEALKLPVNTLSQRSASYHKQSVDILAIRVSTCSSLVIASLSLASARSEVVHKRETSNRYWG